MAGMAQAASLVIDPVRIEFANRRPYATLRLTNQGDSPITVQARVFRWGFKGEEDVLVPSDEVILNPPLLTIEPHAERILRLGLRVPNNSSAEQTYRLILDEIPKAQAESQVSAVNVVLRISIPIFAKPKGNAAPRLAWTARALADGKVEISAVNSGSAHVQIKQLTISKAGAQAAAVTQTTHTYLLPKQQHKWEIARAEKTGATQLVVHAVTDAGDINETLDLPPDN